MKDTTLDKLDKDILKAIANDAKMPVKKIAEIEDGAKTSYTDSKGECGKEYFYYITARQTIDEQHVFGEASVVMSAASGIKFFMNLSLMKCENVVM